MDNTSCESIDQVTEEVEKAMRDTFGQNPTKEQKLLYMEKAYIPIKRIFCQYVCELSNCTHYGGIRFEGD